MKANLKYAPIIALNILITLVNLTFALFFDKSSGALELALLLTGFGIAQVMASWIIQAAMNWLLLQEEITRRLQLQATEGTRNSTSNVDVVLGINAVRFFVNAPSMFIALLVYVGYLLIRSPESMALSLCVGAALFVPVKRYALWRSGRIRRIRRLRNKLVDSGQSVSGDKNYRRLILQYAERRRRFWRRDVSLGLVFRGIILVVVALGLYINRGSPNILSIAMVQLMLLGSIQQLFTSFTVYQEDYRSYKYVKSVLASAPK